MALEIKRKDLIWRDLQRTMTMASKLTDHRPTCVILGMGRWFAKTPNINQHYPTGAEECPDKSPTCAHCGRKVIRMILPNVLLNKEVCSDRLDWNVRYCPVMSSVSRGLHPLETCSTLGNIGQTTSLKNIKYTCACINIYHLYIYM